MIVKYIAFYDFETCIANANELYRTAVGKVEIAPMIVYIDMSSPL